LKSVVVGDLHVLEMLPFPDNPFETPDKPTESTGDRKFWKHVPKCNHWVTATMAPAPVQTVSPALTSGLAGSTLVMDEICVFHQRKNGKLIFP